MALIDTLVLVLAGTAAMIGFILWILALASTKKFRIFNKARNTEASIVFIKANNVLIPELWKNDGSGVFHSQIYNQDWRGLDKVEPIYLFNVPCYFVALEHDYAYSINDAATLMKILQVYPASEPEHVMANIKLMHKLIDAARVIEKEVGGRTYKSLADLKELLSNEKYEAKRKLGKETVEVLLDTINLLVDYGSVPENTKVEELDSYIKRWEDEIMHLKGADLKYLQKRFIIDVNKFLRFMESPYNALQFSTILHAATTAGESKATKTDLAKMIAAGKFFLKLSNRAIILLIVVMIALVIVFMFGGNIQEAVQKAAEGGVFPKP